MTSARPAASPVGSARHLVALGVLLVACSSGGGKDSTPTAPTPVLSTVTVALSPSTIQVGQSSIASAAGLDQNGAAISVGAVTWSSGSPGIASVTAGGAVSGVAPGQAQIVAQSGGKQGSQLITIVPVPVSSVTVAPVNPALVVGATQQLSATTLDAGNTVLTGRVVTWSSSDSTKVTVSAAGLATAIVAGTATITASSEGKTGSTVITVSPPPVATVTVAPPAPSVSVGGTIVLTATAKDAGGNVLSGRVFSWVSSAPSVANGTFNGNVLTLNALAVGTSTITATSEGKNGTSIVTVLAAAPLITAVAPATLTPGGTVTITGSGFAAIAGNNTVSIGGTAATITGASTTQLTATVPCVVSGTVPVVVSAGGANSNSVNSPLVGTTQTLAVGQSVALLTEASVRCNELPVTGGRYLISLFNTSTTPSANTPVVIRGASLAPGTSASSTEAMQLQPLRPARIARPLTPEEESRAASARHHMASLDRNNEILTQALSTPGFAAAQRAARNRASGISRTVAPLTPGSTMTIHYASGSCNNFSNVTARVVAVTTHGIVLEDNASPTAGQVDADLTALGQLFESTLYPIEANFGDVNAYDVPGALDNAGKVLMLFTLNENIPAANGATQLGHVISCDLVPTALPGFAGSNQTKIFYARVPKFLAGSASTLDTRAWWNASMPGTLVHEAKHLTAYAERLSRRVNAVFEESWLEEATAQVAAEIYSRSVYSGTSWKGNTTYANSIFCDARVGTAQCPNGQHLMQSHFLFLSDYYLHDDTKSILSPGSVDGDIYGSAWMFARWLVDQYGGATESTLLRALVQEGTLTGVANVTAKTGVPFANLLADWTMMLVADDYPGFTPPAGAKFTFPSWNTRDIWSGFNADFGSSHPVFPLFENLASFGSFNLGGTLAGAAAKIIELSGAQSAKQLLDLSGLAAGTTIRMSILRVQ